MKQRTHVIGMAALLAGLCILQAQDTQSPWEPSAAESKRSGPLALSATSLGDLKSLLDKEIHGADALHRTGEADLYYDAMTAIQLHEADYAKDPSTAASKAVFSSCSLLTEAALSQLRVAKNRAEITSLRNDLETTLQNLHDVHEEINRLQESMASELKSALDSEKEKARKMREEAERKFSELQSSLIQVSKDARGTIISMSDILFKTGKADLTADLKTSLAKIAGILIVFKKSNIIVEGHTDNVGGEEYNQKLSERRAENVMNFLMDQGVSPTRLTAVGYGFTRPIADNSTAEGRQQNRRVDLVVQEMKR